MPCTAVPFNLSTRATWPSLLFQVYILTVIGPAGSSGGLALRGLFIGDDEECFNAAAKLSLEVNFTLVPRPIQKVSPWLKERVWWWGGQSWQLSSTGRVWPLLAPAPAASCSIASCCSPKPMHRKGRPSTEAVVLGIPPPPPRVASVYACFVRAGGGVSGSRRVQVDLAGEQEHLPDEDGDGGWRGANRHGPRSNQVRGGPRHRCSHSPGECGCVFAGGT